MLLTGLFFLFYPNVVHVNEPQIAFVGATMIGGTGAPPLLDATIVVTGKRISALGTRPSVQIPPAARVIDVRGKWILPGLIDMHVHLDEDLSPSAFPLFGVTSVRDVGSRLVSIQKLRARAVRGEAIPRIFWRGRNIDEGKPSWWGAVAVKGPDGVPALLKDMAKQGVGGVKLYTLAGPNVTRAVIQEAHRRGWPVTAHLDKTKASDAAKFGIDNLEHVSTLFNDLRPTPATNVIGYLRGFAGVRSVNLDSAPARNLIAALKQHSTAVTPTLTVSTMPVEGERGASEGYRGWADVPTGWKRYWKTPYWSFISTGGWTPPDFAGARAAYVKYQEMVQRLDQAGIPIIAGTDTPAPWVLPGAGLVHELELLVDAGLSPMSAIQAATGRAATVLKREHDVGTIQPGRYADLLVIKADPLSDIHNLRKIHTVYIGGRELNRSVLLKQFELTKEPAPGRPQ